MHQTDFKEGSVSRNIWELSLPLMAAQLINLLYSVVDRIYIGHMGGENHLALTGLGLCFPVITIVAAFACLFGNGGAPLCSMELGRENRDEAEAIMGNSFTCLMIAGILLTTVGLIFHKPILYLFGASDATYPYAAPYMTIYLCGSVFVMIATGMNSFINCQGFGRVGMMTILLGAVVNIVLDPVLIFVFHMGVQGAALATVFSQFLSAAWVLRFLTSDKALLRLQKRTLRPKAPRVKKITALGMSSFVMQVTNGLVQMVCNASLQRWGGELYVGVMTVANTIREVLTTPVMAFSSGAAPVMSFDYGAGEYSRVKKAIRFVAVGCVLYTLAAWLIVSLFPGFVLRLFTGDAQLIQTGIGAIRLYFFGFFMMALQFAGQNVFTALGKSKNAIFFSLFRKVIIVVPLTLLLPNLWGLGVNGVFVAEPISNFIGGAACFITMLCVVLPELSGKQKQRKKA